MPSVIVIDETGIDAFNYDITNIFDISMICNPNCDEDLLHFEWCIDDLYYTIFYIYGDSSECSFTFPPPLDTIMYTGKIIITTSKYSIENISQCIENIEDTSVTQFDYIIQELMGECDSDVDQDDDTTSLCETYEPYPSDEYDSNTELSEEGYI